MTQRRVLTEHESRIAHLAVAIDAAKRQHAEACTDERPRDVAYCSCFWKLVFAGYHKEEPDGDGDKRWDSLFSDGYPVLRSLDGSPP